MVERDQRPAESVTRFLRGADTDPINFSADAFVSRPSANSADADDRIKFAVSKPAHAILYAEAPLGVRITLVSSLIEKRPHGETTVGALCAQPAALNSASILA
jgi:hypothetical protein